MKKRKPSGLRRALILAAGVVALDRATKIHVLETLGLAERGHIPVAEPWFNLVMAWNTGINFGLLNLGVSGRWVLIGVALAIVTGLLFWTWRSSDRARSVGVGLIVGGALGNVWDRVAFGAVADFLNFSCCGIRNPFAFNVADAAIFVGAAVLVLFTRETTAGGSSKRT